MSTQLGAVWSAHETSFSVWSPEAFRVELRLFDPDNHQVETSRHDLIRVDEIWTVVVPDVAPGTAYGFRAHGPYQPKSGLRFNSNKLLVDPYSKSIAGQTVWHPALLAYPLGDPDSFKAESSDSAPFVPRSIVVDDAFDWQGVGRPATPLDRSIVYEAHVKGLTKQHPAIPVELRGTYAGACHPAVIDHLQKLGVTAIEFLPVHSHVDDSFLVERGLVNYWGYNTLGFFSPESSYASNCANGNEVTEFKTMVREFHRAGIEVWLDVVYNHTAEANHQGPTLSFRGLANSAYYRLNSDDKSRYWNVTGTGNTINAFHPQVTQLILDSLRYWVTEMGVDGFRFDLAPVIGRTESDFDRSAPIFKRIAADPILSNAKMIAEPWDLGSGGYQVGNFPDDWSEWNDKFRDNVRSFWRSDDKKVGEFGFRITGSADIFGIRPLGPTAGINFVAAHDGMTTADFVAYQHKRNFENGDNNQDGSDHNFNQYLGPDGPTSLPDIRSQRFQRQRNLLATLFLSRGVPMLLGGDELGRTQLGNNNAYCHDNPTSWIDWDLSPDQQNLLSFVQKCTALRASEPYLRHPNFPEPMVSGDDPWFWFIESGEIMGDRDWDDPERRCFGIYLEAAGAGHLIVLINASGEFAHFKLPLAIPYSEPTVELVLSTLEGDDSSLSVAPSSLSVYRIAPASSNSNESSRRKPHDRVSDSSGTSLNNSCSRND